MDFQKERMVKYCEKSNWRVHKIYIDDINNKDIRFEFNNLVTDIKAGLINIVLFWNFSKFSKGGVINTLDVLEDFEKFGVRWKSYQDSFIDSLNPYRDVAVTIMKTFYSTERRNLTEFSREAIKKSKKLGNKGGPKSNVTQSKINKIRSNYEKEKSFTGTAKLSKTCYDVCRRIIVNDIKTVAEYNKLLLDRQMKKL